MNEHGGSSRFEELRKKWFRKDNLLIFILSGVLLFVIALPTGDKKQGGSNLAGKKTSTEKESILGNDFDGLLEQGGTLPEEEGMLGEMSLQEYALFQERRLKQTLSVMEGVGKVEVMLTLESSEEVVVEKENNLEQTRTEEKDSQGGSRLQDLKKTEEKIVLSSEGGKNAPYVKKMLMPAVEGVVVVAQGAENGDMSRKITQVVQALFGIEPHKVRVVKMETGQ